VSRAALLALALPHHSHGFKTGKCAVDWPYSSVSQVEGHFLTT
jgi:hypothetical protein